MPAPKVDSAVITLKIRENPPITVLDEEGFFKFIKACFAQRRKTLVNTLSSGGFDKTKLREALEELNLSGSVRSEELPLETLAEIFSKISK